MVEFNTLHEPLVTWPDAEGLNNIYIYRNHYNRYNNNSTKNDNQWTYKVVQDEVGITCIVNLIGTMERGVILSPI